MAIFVISVPQAAAMTNASEVAAVEAHHSHRDGSHMGMSHEEMAHGDEASLACDVQADAADDCSGHEQDSHHAGGSSCCSMGGCHSFQVSTAPDLVAQPIAAASIIAFGDEQVAGTFSLRIDRPPRTV
jgi:hypothetical protein